MRKVMIGAVMISAMSACSYQPFGPPCSGFLPEGESGLTIVRGSAEEEAARFEYYQCLARRAVEEGQYRTGIAYEEGLGTAIDLEKALYWYRQAASPKSGFEFRTSVSGRTKGQYLPYPTGEKSEGHEGAKLKLKSLRSTQRKYQPHSELYPPPLKQGSFSV